MQPGKDRMVAAAGLLASVTLLFAGSGAAQEIHRIPDEPKCPDCSIELTTLVRLGATDGPGMIDWRGGQSFPALDSRGRIYLRGMFGTEVKVYSSEGEYLSTIGRGGQGPGEFRGVMGLAVDSADSLFVLDVLNMRLSVFDPDQEFVRSAPLQVPPPGYGPDILPWDRDHFYMSAHLRNTDLAGWPIHRIDRQGGRVQSFGTRDGEPPTLPYDGMRVIADGGGGTLWSGRIAHYELERRTPDSPEPLEVIRRDSEWFPIPTPDELDIAHQPDKPPPPLLADVRQEGDRLWVLAWATDPEWRSASEELEDEWLRYDSVIEVIDLTDYRVIARVRFEELYHELLGDGRIGGTVFEGGLVPVYHIKQMRVVRRADPG